MQDLIDRAAEMKQQAVAQSGDTAMPLLMRQDRAPLSDYWYWLP
jgi:hypothetical protein